MDVTPAEIRALRQRLGLDQHELAAALGVEEALVRDWERGDRFPTRRAVETLSRLDAGDPPASALPAIAPAPKALPRGLSALGHPGLWSVVRKLAAHPELFERVLELAREYPDPADDG